MATNSDLPPDHDHWLVRPQNIRKLWVAFIAILALTVAAEFVWHPHPHFTLDAIFGFGAWYGFLACVALVAFAKVLGVLLKRKDTYYE